MQIIKIVHSIVIYLIATITYVIGTSIALSISLTQKDTSQPFLIAAHLWAKLLIGVSGSRVKVQGIENFPKSGGLVLVANHQSATDIIVLLASLPQGFRFIIKQELFKVPVFGWYLRKAGYLSIDRDSGRSAIKTLHQAKELIHQGNNILIFPEGTRSKDGKVGEFKRGSLMLAFISHAPILPITIDGSCNIMQKGGFILNYTKVNLTISPLIKTEVPENHKKEDQEKVLNQVREQIISKLSRLD